MTPRVKARWRAGKTLDAMQRAVVRKSIGKRHILPMKVNFLINGDLVVPRSVVLYDLPETIIGLDRLQPM
jgi:hypothetical protein